jgi:hypothetical protein
LHSPSTVSTASRRQWGGQHNASGRALSVAGSAAAHRDPEAAAAAAAGTLSEMKQWAIDQELSMMEVCTYVPCVCMSLCMHFDHQIQEDLWVRMVLRSLLYCVQVILVATCMLCCAACSSCRASATANAP